MGRHSSDPGRGRRIIDPLLVGSLVVGVAFVGISLATQRTPATVPRADPNSIAAASETHVGSMPAGSDETPTRPGSTVSRATATGPARVLPEAAPVSLDIGAIGVHSRLHDLGLDENGAIEAPSGVRYDEAAWYRHSPKPGSLGPSIILGHVDSAANGPSVFFRLAELVRGDRISVTRADGSTARFVVESIGRFSKEDFPTERVYGDLDHAGLRLITCGGAFNQTSGHYEDNVVVFARLATT